MKYILLLQDVFHPAINKKVQVIFIAAFILFLVFTHVIPI